MYTKIKFLKEVNRYIMVRVDGSLFWENGKQIKTTLYRGRERVKIRSKKGSNAPKRFYTYKIHRIVAETFGNSVEGLDVHHKDGNKTNNHADNLVPATKQLHNKIHAQQKVIQQLQMSPRIMALQEKCQAYVPVSLEEKFPKKSKRICGFPLG